MTIPVCMRGLTVNAVVDTAAQVTLVSRKLGDRLALPYMHSVPLTGAAEGSRPTFKACRPKSIGVTKPGTGPYIMPRLQMISF